MAIKEWHPAQLTVFWIVLILFAVPLWLVLTMGASFLMGRYAYQDWFGRVPLVLAFVVGFGTILAGLWVTLRWTDREARAPAENRRT